MRRLTLPLLAASIAVGTGACKAKAPPPPPVPVAPAPAPAPPPIAMAGVELGRSIGGDKKVTAPLTVFGVRDTIYASVATTGVSSGATLLARWTFQTGQVVDSSAMAIAPTGPATTEFHIAKKTAWPVGRYKVAVSLDGGTAIEKEFEVKK